MPFSLACVYVRASVRAHLHLMSERKKNKENEEHRMDLNAHTKAKAFAFPRKGKEKDFITTALLPASKSARASSTFVRSGHT